MARLVHGSTDLLQPINLLPNSDFSRSGGYPTSGTVVLTSSNSFNICDKLNITCGSGLSISQCTINYTVTNSKVTLECINGGKGTGGSQYTIICLRNVLNSNSTSRSLHTLTAKIKLVNGSFSMAPSAQLFWLLNSSRIVYYQGYAQKGSEYTVTQIACPASSFTYDISMYPYIYVYIPFNSTTTFEFYDYCFYEGAYTNPPVAKSLDAQPGNQFALSYTSGKIELQNDITIKNAGWYRVARLADSDDSLNCVGRFMMTPTSDVNYNVKIIGNFGIYSNNKGFIDILSAYRLSSLMNITKIRITSVDNGAFGYRDRYFEIYIPNNLSNNTYVYPFIELINDCKLSQRNNFAQVGLGLIYSSTASSETVVVEKTIEYTMMS